MTRELRSIVANGWGGVQIWCKGEGVWNGCLTRSFPDFRPDYETNVWDDMDDPETVLEALAEKAQRIGPPPQKEIRR